MMHSRILPGFLGIFTFLVLSLPIITGVYRCPPAWHLHGKYCYHGNYSHFVTWHQARHICSTIGGYLAEILTYEQHDFIEKILVSSDVWIGLHDTVENGKFVWAHSNTPMDYSAWAFSEPNDNDENCATFNNYWKGGGQWYDSACPAAWYYICEKNKDSDSCDEGWGEFKGHCYLFSGATRSWQDARNDCITKGADLVTIDDAEEQAYILKQQPRQVHWIGLNDKAQEGAWVWLDQTKQATFTHWSLGQPDNRKNGLEECAGMWPFSVNQGLWTSDTCQMNLALACEKAQNNNNTCGPGWLSYQKQCYFFNATSLHSWAHAREACRAEGGDLVRVDDLDEQTFIMGVISDRTWIGLHLGTSKHWHWLDDETQPSFLYWQTGEPAWLHAPRCVTMYNSGPHSGRWDNIGCLLSAGYICEGVNKTQPGICNPPWIPHNGQCYYISDVSDAQLWSEARQRCKQWAAEGRQLTGVDLVSLEDEAEYTFIKELVHDKKTTVGYWIGLKADKDKNTYTWVAGDKQPTIDKWVPGSPRVKKVESCVEMYSEGRNYRGRWNDEQCAMHNAYLCQKEADEMFYDFAGEKSVYKVVDYALSWDDASSFCVQLFGSGGTLVSVDSREELDILQSELAVRFPHNDIKVWIQTSAEGLIAVHDEGLVIINDTLVPTKTCSCMHKSHKDTWTPQFSVLRSSCCQRRPFVCEKTMNNYINIDGLNQFVIQGMLYSMVADKTTSEPAADNLCQELLDGEGKLADVTSLEMLHAIGQEIKVRHKESNQEFFIKIDYENSETALMDQLPTVPNADTCWAITAGDARKIDWTLESLLKRLKQVSCDSTKNLICQRPITKIEASGNKDEIVQNAVLNHENKVLKETLVGPPIQHLRREENEVICNTLCLALGVMLALVIIAAICAVVSMYLYYKRHPSVAFMFKKHVDEVQMAPSSSQQTK